MMRVGNSLKGIASMQSGETDVWRKNLLEDQLNCQLSNAWGICRSDIPELA